jgi:uncharacterized protein (TIGR01777 family)
MHEALLTLIAMRVAVTGASGLIGSALCARLEGLGHEVTRVVRHPLSDAGRTLTWDPDDGTIDAQGLEGLDGVVHLAGAGVADHRWTPTRKQVVLESRTRSTALLSRTLAGLKSRPPVLVSGSAIGFYGDCGDDTVTEGHGPGGDFLASVCQSWEAATAPASEAGIRVSFARTGLVLDNEGGALPKLLRLFRLGLGGRFGSGTQWWSWITIDDEVAALVWLLEHDQVGPVNLTAPGAVTNRDFTTALGAALSRPALLPVPRFGPSLLLGAELAGSLLFTSARVRPAVLEAEGFVFSEPQLEAALRRLLSHP